jgi:hypothetical protein
MFQEKKATVVMMCEPSVVANFLTPIHMYSMYTKIYDIQCLTNDTKSLQEDTDDDISFK